MSPEWTKPAFRAGLNHKFIIMLKITCKALYTYIVDSVTIVKDQAVIVLDKNRGIKMIPLSDILLIEKNEG